MGGFGQMFTDYQGQEPEAPVQEPEPETEVVEPPSEEPETDPPDPDKPAGIIDVIDEWANDSVRHIPRPFIKHFRPMVDKLRAKVAKL